jgi:hypothetical protein
MAGFSSVTNARNIGNRGEIMIIRLLLVLLMATTVYASEFIDNWKPGKVEKLSYEVKTIVPRETFNYIDMTVTRKDGPKPIFVIDQKLTIPSQLVIMFSTETYAGENLQIVSSENRYKLPDKAAKKAGIDTLVIAGQADSGKFKISFNTDKAPGSVLPLDKPLVTTVGYRLVSRNMDFKVGNYSDYGFVNLLTISDSISEVPMVRDSIIGTQEVETPVGDFQCYKVKNSVSGIESYNYYTTDARHIPVKTEIVDDRNGELVMTVTLQKYE